MHRGPGALQLKAVGHRMHHLNTDDGERISPAVVSEQMVADHLPCLAEFRSCCSKLWTAQRLHPPPPCRKQESSLRTLHPLHSSSLRRPSSRLASVDETSHCPCTSLKLQRRTWSTAYTFLPVFQLRLLLPLTKQLGHRCSLPSRAFSRIILQLDRHCHRVTTSLNLPFTQACPPPTILDRVRSSGSAGRLLDSTRATTISLLYSFPCLLSLPSHRPVSEAISRSSPYAF